MKSLLSSLVNKKTFASILAVLSIVGYGAFVFAVGPFAPGTELDPACSPYINNDPLQGPDPDCTVSQAWEQNLDDGFVFNLGSNVGIGTDEPEAKLHIIPDNILDSEASFLVGDESFFGIANSGNIYQVKDTIINASQNNTQNFAHVMDHEITLDGNSVNALIGGLDAKVNISGAGDLGESFNSSAVYAQMISQSSVSMPNTTLNGFTGAAFHGSAADIGTLNGFQAAVLNQGTGTVGLARGATISVLGLNGNIEVAHGFNIELVSLGGTIQGAVGINMTAGPSYAAINGITEATAINISQDSGNNFPAVYSENIAYGIFMSSDAIRGNNGSYALYIADTVAENYFANGVRLGINSNDYKLEAVQNGPDAELYFGTDLVHFYTPSDERLKTNIQASSLSLDILGSINIVDFTYNQDVINDNNRQHHGVIAQELEQLYPYAVKERRDGYKVVDYSAITPLILKSIQELDLKLENIQSSSTTIISSGFSLDSIRDWLGDIGNGIQKIVASVIEGTTIRAKNQLCVGDTCISESEFIELLNSRSIESNPFNESSGGGLGNESDDEEIISDDQESNDDSIDELVNDQENDGINDNYNDVNGGGEQLGEDSVDPSEADDGDEVAEESLSESGTESEEPSQQETESQVDISLE